VSWAGRRSRYRGAAPPSSAGHTPFHCGDPSGGSRRGSCPDPAQPQDPAGRRPGGSLAASPPVTAEAAAPAPDSRAGRSCSCPIVPGRSIADTGIWADLTAFAEGRAWIYARHAPRNGKIWNASKEILQLFLPQQDKDMLLRRLNSKSTTVMSELQAFLGLRKESLLLESGVNVSGMQTNKYVHSLFNSLNPIRKLVKPFLPSHNIRKRLVSLVNNNNSRKQCLTLAQRNFLASIFSEDILEAEDLLGTSLAHWRVS